MQSLLQPRSVADTERTLKLARATLEIEAEGVRALADKLGEAFLAAHPEIEAFDIILHDANGIGRGKIIRRHELLSFYNNGRHLPISILGLDICGEDVHETGLIWDQGDGDLRAWPIPGPLKPLRGLRRLCLSGAPMVDLSPLCELPALQELMLDGSTVVDIHPMATAGALPALKHVWLWGAPIDRAVGSATMADVEALRSRGVVMEL